MSGATNETGSDHFDIPAVKAPAGTDDLARREFEAIISGRDIDAEADERDHDRFQRIAEAASYLAIALICTVAILLIAAIAVCGIHLLAPEGWTWLDAMRLEKLKDILFSGTLAASMTALGRYIFRRRCVHGE